MLVRKIKLCHVVCDLTNGGVEAILLSYFSHMDLSPFDLHLITYGVTVPACADRFRRLGFVIHAITPKRAGLFKSLREMDGVMRAAKFDIVHAHLTEWNALALFFAWRHGARMRVSHSHLAGVPKGLAARALFCVQKALGKLFATDWYACGEAAGRSLFGKRAARNGRVFVLKNVIDVKRFAPNEAVREQTRKELGIAQSALCVGHVGRFLEQKNHLFLLDAFAALKVKRPDCVLLLAGVGERMGAARDKAQSLGLQDAVRFLGARDDVHRLMQAMDVFVLPSLYEGFPVCTLEAQAAGLPCLIADTVTPAAKLRPNAAFFPLRSDAGAWADAILKAAGLPRERGAGPLAAYDIAQNAKNLLSRYLHAMR